MTRIEALKTLTDDELASQREVLAEEVDRLWGRLELLDDELMHRRREARRARILAPPPALDDDLIDHHLQTAGAA